MRSVIRSLACGLGLCLSVAATHAVVLGAIDTFEDGSGSGWHVGFQSPLPPVNVATGGPAGVDDNYLLLAANGSGTAGGRLTVIAGAQWLGDYMGAGVNAITMDLRNLGATDLSLRLYVAGSNGGTGLTPAVTVVAGGSWQAVTFSLASLAANGPVALPLLTAVTDIRLFHDAAAPGFPGEPVVAQLGMDNVAAVPEPASSVLLACGLLALAWRKTWRSRPLLPAPFS